MKAKTYLAVMEPCETGYGVFFPDFPGCAASGKNIEQAAKNAREALSMHYCGLKEEGERIPEPSQSLSEKDTAGNLVVPITICPELVMAEY